MTRLDPSLFLNRLVVLKDGLRAYDEAFHVGVNIIRGIPGEGNSVGKSTIADLIFYGLGGDLTVWKDEAALCDEVLAEVSLSGSRLTLRREITDSGQQPMWIFFGSFEDAVASAADGWQRFTYRRLSDRESFTQVLFRAMGMPEVPSEAEANITMHQLLRLMYVDQMTPVDRIFRFERNDSALRRQAVGDLLCGAFDDRIYPAQLELREKEKAWETATQQYNALHRVLTASGEAFNLDFVVGRENELKSEMARTAAEIAQLKTHRFDDSRLPPEHAAAISELKIVLDKVNADLTEARRAEGQLAYAIADSALLLDEIERSLERLKQGEITSASIGSLDFQFCPSCFAPLKALVEDGHCKVCREHLDRDGEESRIARMRNELEIQFKESTQLQKGRQEEIAVVRADINKMEVVQKALSARFSELSLNFISESDARIEALTSRTGYLERELIDLQREKKIAEQLDQLSSARALLNEEVSRLKSNIQVWQGQKERRQAQAYQLIQRLTSYILARDLHTEAEFAEDSQVYFNFAEDRVTVNGKSGFSASSLTVLRNAFHLALHWASCREPAFRYPRFLVMDNIEDKGMTERRSQNFQRLLIEISNTIQYEHQIILTTSMIAPEFDTSELTVGELYTFANKSLKVGRGISASLQFKTPQAVSEYSMPELPAPQLDKQVDPLLALPTPDRR